MVAPSEVLQNDQRTIIPRGVVFKTEPSTRSPRDDRRKLTHKEGLNFMDVIKSNNNTCWAQNNFLETMLFMPEPDSVQLIINHAELLL